MGSRWKRARTLVHVSVVAGGSVVYSVSQWAMLILFARATSQTGFGKYTYALAITAPFFIFFGFSLRQVYVSESRGSRAWYEYLALRLVSSGAALLLAVLFALFNEAMSGVYFIVCVVKAIDLVADMYLGPAQSDGRVWSLGFYQMTNGLASLSLFGLGLLLEWQPVYALAMSIAGSIVAGTYALWVGECSLKRSAPSLRVAPRAVWHLVLVAAPLGVAGSLNSATQAAPRYALERAEGLAAVGVFSAMAYLLIAGNTVVSAVIQHELPRSVHVFRVSGRRAVKRRVFQLTALMVVLGLLAIILVWFWGDPVMTLLYGPGYGHKPTLMLLGVAWALGAVSWVWDMALVVERAFVTQMVAAGTGTLFSVLLSITVVEQLGLLGAGLATLVANLAIALVRIAGLTRISIQRGHRGVERHG